MTLPFDHTHKLDLGVEISRSESEIAWSQEWDGRLTWNEKDVSHPFMTMILTCVTMVRWADLPDSHWGDFRRWHAVDISSYYCAAHHVSDTLWYMVSWYLYHNMLMYHDTFNIWPYWLSLLLDEINGWNQTADLFLFSPNGHCCGRTYRSPFRHHLRWLTLCHRLFSDCLRSGYLLHGCNIWGTHGWVYQGLSSRLSCTEPSILS